MKEPLTHLASAPGPAEDDALAAKLVRANLAAPDFSPEAKERVRRRLRQSKSTPLRLQLRPAFALSAVVLSSLATAAALYYRPVWPLRPKPQAPNTSHRIQRVVPKEEPAAEPPRPVEAPAPSPVEAVPVPAPAHRTSHRLPAPKPLIAAAPPATTPLTRSVAAAVPDSPTPEIPSAVPAPAAGGAQVETPRAELNREMPAFRQALRALNVEHDGEAALRALDAYREQFPAGVFRKEAFVARVDALLMLGRRDEALAELESAGTSALRHMPKGEELGVLRGELLQESGDCKAALLAFEEAIHAGNGQLMGRALWGRAGCRAALGDSAASRADLERYLQLYPTGAFAQKARAALAAP